MAMAEWWTPARVSMVGGAATALSVSSPWWVDVSMAAGAGVGAATAAVTVVALTARWRRDRQPLALSARALVGEVSGHPVYRFRARLGQGRPVKGRRVTLTWHPEEGTAVALPCEDVPAGTTLGPFTVVAIDRARAVDGPGVLELSVEAFDGERTWTARRRWPVDRLQRGRFDAGVIRRGDRLDFDPARWDAVVDEAGPVGAR